jgi:hypothetical protein
MIPFPYSPIEGYIGNLTVCRDTLSWLRHYATDQNVTSSIPDEVIEFPS